MGTKKIFGNTMQSNYLSKSKYILVYIVIFTIGLCIGTKFILSNLDASTIVVAVIVNGYTTKISGNTILLISEYLWQFLLLFLLVYICLYCKIGNILINILPIFYGVYVGVWVTTLMIYFNGEHIMYLIFGVYIPAIIHSILYMCIYNGVVYKTIQIYGKKNQSIIANKKGLSILGYLVLCLIVFITEIGVYIFIY